MREGRIMRQSRLSTRNRIGILIVFAIPFFATSSSSGSPAPLPPRPVFSMTAATDGVAQLALAPEAFSDLQSGPADRILTVPGLGGELFELELTRFTVTLPTTQFRSATPAGQVARPAPEVVNFRGRIAGQPGSHAFFSLTSGGTVNGYITRPDGRRFFLSGQQSNVAAGGGITLSTESATPGIFGDIPSCGVDHTHDLRIQMTPSVAAGINPNPSPRVLFVAIDSDQEYYQLFNDETAAQAYMVQLIAAISDIYIRDFGAKLVLTFSRIWPAGGEPFSADSLSGFANYWFSSEDPTPYHLIHLFSGRRNTPYGGVAYVAGSCSGSAFGISAFLLGSFPTPVGESSLGTWDLVVVAHEMGHNMGTYHTHDGYNPPIDQCANGVWSRGEIMSYCHIVPGGLLNTDLRFTSRVQEVIRDDLAINNCQFFDCNGNNVDDAIDIAALVSADVNGNGIPDECEDCNDNGILDPQEIVLGAPDVNGNGIPDECEPDCNGNGIPDSHDVALGAPDLNLNRVPDSCEADCDENGTADFVQIQSSGGTLDINRDGVLDACQDCNDNGITDYIDLLRPHHVYIADTADFVREYHSTSGAPVGNIAQGSLLDPHDVTFGPDRFLYIADFGNNRVVRANPETGAFAVFGATGGGSANAPSAVRFGPNGNLFVLSNSANRVVEFDGATGAFIRDVFPSGSGGLTSAYGLAFLPNGNLLVAGGNRVNEHDTATGAFIRNFVAPGAGGLSSPRAIALLPDGRLLVVNRSSNQILAFDSNGASLGQYNDEYPLGGLWGIAVGPNGNVYVTRVSGGVRVIEYEGASGRYIRSFIRGDSALSQPTGLAFRPESPVDCNENYVLDECEIANGTLLDENNNGIPDMCESACSPLPPPAASADGVNKNRYLTFDMTTAAPAVRAVHVTPADLPPPFESFEGQGYWVGPPQDRPDGLNTTFKVSSLQCDPFYSDWSGVEELSVISPAIVPGGTYEVHSIVDGCNLQEQFQAAGLVVLTVARWGDVIVPFNPPSLTVQPDLADVSAMVDKFRNLEFAVSMNRADVSPDLPDQVVDFSDISLVVDAFRGTPYPFPGPIPCP
jgi:sugar lactone lactonase YvrE